MFAGNTHDSQTLQTIVATMQARHGVLARVWVGDRGMASAENLTWLRQTGRRYIIGAPKSDLKKFASELANRDGWRVVRANSMRCDAERKPGSQRILGRAGRPPS